MQSLLQSRNGGNTCQLILWGQNCPNPKPDKNKQDQYRCKNLWGNKVQQYIKRMLHHNQVRFISGMQGSFILKNQLLRKIIIVICHISLKKRKYMIMSVDPE